MNHAPTPVRPAANVTATYPECIAPLPLFLSLSLPLSLPLSLSQPLSLSLSLSLPLSLSPSLPPNH